MKELEKKVESIAVRVETKKEEVKKEEAKKAGGQSFGGFKKGFFSSGPSKPKQEQPV
jgi:hypothetical protein